MPARQAPLRGLREICCNPALPTRRAFRSKNIAEASMIRKPTKESQNDVDSVKIMKTMPAMKPSTDRRRLRNPWRKTVVERTSSASSGSVS